MSRELQHKHTMGQFEQVCHGTNCNASKAMPHHSTECKEQHDAAYAGVEKMAQEAGLAKYLTPPGTNEWHGTTAALASLMRHAGSVALNAARENELHAAQEADELRALVRRQLQWQKHRDSVGIVMNDAEYAWIADAEAALASNADLTRRP